MMITTNYLNCYFEYDPDKGVVYNRVTRGQRAIAGNRAGHFSSDGYRSIQINGFKYKEHRLIWVMLYGYWPLEIDHKDGNGYNNKLENLREATRSENTCNSERAVGESSLRGVKFDPNTSTWRARIAFGYQRNYLGPFGTAEEAYAAYLAASNFSHGEFALHKRNPSLGA